MTRQATIFQNIDGDRARKALETATVALFKSASRFRPESLDSDYRRAAGEYYATSVLSAAEIFQQFSISRCEVGLKFLKACFVNLDKLSSEELSKRRSLLYNKLSCDTASITDTMRREMARDSFLAKILQY